MKVLHVLEAIEGGTSRHLRYVVGSVKADHIVVVPPERIGGLTDAAAFDTMEAAGAELHLIPMRRSPTSRRNVSAVAQVQRLIRRQNPDVIHGHSSIGGAVARLAAVGPGAPCVYTPNGLFPWLSAMAIERALGRITDTLIASSRSEAQLVQQLRLVPRDRMVVIPNAIELDPAPPTSIDVRSELGVSQDTPVVGTVARLVAQKAPEVFVRACGIVAQHEPATCFVLVGDGPLIDLVTNEIEQAGIADRFLLLRNCNEGPSLMNQFDVFALSSRYEAGAAFAPMEAMRAGTAVVLTDVMGNHDAVDHGRSGFVVPPENPRALAEAVVTLLTNKSLRQDVADEARLRLAERFDVRLVADQLGEMYRLAAENH